MAPLARAVVVHQAPGRMRLRIPERKRQAAFFERLKSQLAAPNGIVSVEANPLTGSVTIAHSLDVEQIARHAREAGLFEIDTRGREPVAVALAQGSESLDRRLRRASGGSLDLFSVAFLGLAGVGVWQLVRGNVSAPAVTLFWYAASLILMARSAAAERELASNFLQGGSADG